MLKYEYWSELPKLLISKYASKGCCNLMTRLNLKISKLYIDVEWRDCISLSKLSLRENIIKAVVMCELYIEKSASYNNILKLMIGTEIKLINNQATKLVYFMCTYDTNTIILSISVEVLRNLFCIPF